MKAYNTITLTKTKVVDDYPITVREAKTHMGYGVNDLAAQEDYLAMLIRAVTKEAEDFIQKDICLTNNTYTFYDFSDDDVEIPEGHFYELTQIVTDTSTLVTPSYTFPYENYVLFEFSSSISSDPLVVQFQTGFEKENCPENFKLAIMMRIFDYFLVHRGSKSTLSLQDTQTFEKLLMTAMSTRIP